MRAAVQKCFPKSFPILSLLLALGLAADARAQQSPGQQSRGEQFPRQRSAFEGRGASATGNQQEGAWVRIAADYDRDGRWDATDTIHRADLRRATERSRRRAADTGRMPQADRRQAPREGEWQQVRVQGQIENLDRIDLIGSGEKDVVVGRVQTDDGRGVSVYFGPTNVVSDLNLQEGDRVTVVGMPARLNEQPLVIGRRITSGGRTVTLEMLRRSDLRQFSGRVEGLRRTRFRGREGTFVIARLRLDDGPTRTVNLGREQELQNLNLQPGDEVKLLARPGRMNDRPALIAQLIRANEATADVREETRTAFRGNGR